MLVSVACPDGIRIGSSPGAGCPGLLREVGEQRSAEVALAVARHDDHDEFAGVLRPLGDLDRRPEAAPEEMPTSRPSSLALRRAVAIASSDLDLDDLVIDLGVEDLRHKPAPIPCSGCGPWGPPESTGTPPAQRRRPAPADCVPEDLAHR